MRIDLRWTPLLALLTAACWHVPPPSDTDAPGGGASMPPPGGDDDPPDADPSPPPASVGRPCAASGGALPHGSPVPSGDTCNSCLCYDSNIICTSSVCEPEGCDPSLVTPDGLCALAPGDPCVVRDADCSPDAGAPPDAGPAPRAACEVAGQSFPDGSAVPSGDSCNTCICSDASVACTEIACDPVFCAEFVEELDGVCARFPRDPCIEQDPDCASTSLPPEL